MDTFTLRALVEDAIAQLEETPEDEGGVLRTVLIVCEVDLPNETRFVHVCNDDRPWFVEAFANEYAQWVHCVRSASLTQGDDD